MPKLPGYSFCVANWRTGLIEEVWDELGQYAAKMPKAAVPKGVDPQNSILVGPAISRGKSYIGQLVCGKDSDKKFLRWTFVLRPHPETKPPSYVLESSEKVGGLEGAFNLLKQIHGEAGSIPAAYRATLRLNSKDGWQCNLLPKRAGKEFKALGALSSSASIEQLGCRFQGGLLGLEEMSVVYYHAPKFFDLSFSANGVLRLGKNTFTYVDVLTDAVVRELFTHE